MPTSRVTQHPWPYRSTQPGASDSFDIDGLQDLLRKQDELLTWVQETPPETPKEGDRWVDTARRTLKLYFSGKWFAALPTYLADSYLKHDGTDTTTEWVGMLQAIAAAGGEAVIEFGEGIYAIGAHLPVANLANIWLRGKGEASTTILALPGTTDIQTGPSTLQLGVYATTPLRFTGLDRLVVSDLTVDCTPLSTWAVEKPYLSLLYDNVLHPTYHGARIGDGQLKSWDATQAPGGSVLILGLIDGEPAVPGVSTSAWEQVTIQTVDDANTSTLATPLVQNWPVNGVDTAVFAVSKDVSTGGYAMDARQIGHLTVRNVTTSNTFRAGIHHHTVGMVDIFDSSVLNNGMLGGFGHLKEYPFASQLTGCIGGYSVNSVWINRCVIDESSNHAVMFRVTPKSVDFGQTVGPSYDIQVTECKVRHHGTYTYVKGNGSGINIVTNRNDATLGRIILAFNQIVQTVDGPIWIVAPDGHVVLEGNEIELSYGPSIALQAPCYAIIGNTIRNSGYYAIGATATARSGDYADRYGVDTADGLIANNVIVHTLRQAIKIGTDTSGKPPKSSRRVLISHNQINGCGLEGIQLEEIDGVVECDGNSIRNSSRLNGACMVPDGPVQTTPDGSTTGPWTTIQLAGPVPDYAECNYFKFADDPAATAYRVVDVNRTTNKVRLAETPTDHFLGPLYCPFPSPAAIHVEGRRPFTTTIAGTGTSGSVATVTAASVGAIGNGLVLYDRIAFGPAGADASVYQVTAIAGSLLTLDKPFDAATVAGGYTAIGQLVSLVSVYRAREVSIRGGLIGDDEDMDVCTKAGVQLERTGGLVTVEGVRINRIRECGVDIIDATPRPGGVSGAVTRCTFANIGIGPDAAEIRRAAVTLTSTDPLASNAGWDISGNRLTDDQPTATIVPGAFRFYVPQSVSGWAVGDSLTFDGEARTLRNIDVGRQIITINVPTTLPHQHGATITNTTRSQSATLSAGMWYGLLIDGSGVAGGSARDNDFADAAMRAFEVNNGASYQAWDRERNVYPWFNPNNDDLSLLEEYPPSVTGTTGQVGTHGLNTGGTISVLTPTPNLIGGRLVTNNGAVLGFASLGVLANGLVDAADGWDWHGYFSANHADGQYRAGMLNDPANNVPTYGAYFERLITDKVANTTVNGAYTVGASDDTIPVPTTAALAVNSIVYFGTDTAGYTVKSLTGTSITVTGHISAGTLAATGNLANGTAVQTSNWMLVTNNNTAITRTNTGVSFFAGGYYVGRIRRTSAPGTPTVVPTVEWSLARAYGNVADRKGKGAVTTNLPPTGQVLCAVNLQVFDGAGGAANKQGRVERLHFKVHGIARA